MLKTLYSSVNNGLFLCLFLPPGRLNSSLTWREGRVHCPLRSLSQSLLSLGACWLLAVSSSMTQRQWLSSCGDTEDRCLSILNAALQFFPVIWQVIHVRKWTVAPVLRFPHCCPPWRRTRHSC